MYLHDRFAHVLADLEAYGNHRTTAFCRGVGVAYPRYFHEDAFQRFRHQAGNLFGRRAGVLHEQVDHRHRNLRVFLTWRKHQADEANEQ